MGIGKTTLARLVFDDRKVSQHFDIKAWAQLLHTFDNVVDNTFDVLKAIFESLTLQPCRLKEVNLLQVRLQEILKGKKFLLVLDDMCSNKSTDIYKNIYKKWLFLLSSFEGAAKESCVIVTTDIRSIASMVGTVSAYHMRALSSPDCWSLFAKFAFGNENPSSYPELEAIGRQIAQKCHGLPLAVRALGAVLRFKRQVEEWSAILDHLKHLSFSSVGNDIINLHLRLSYDHLPAHLKRCIAYCSILPPHTEFEKEKLVLLWMAEGLLQQPGANCRMEKIGEEYFQELLFRSFFQQSSCNKSGFMMHHLMSNLASLVSGEYCFRLKDDNTSHISIRTRYLSYLPTLVGEDKKGIERSKKVSLHSPISIIPDATYKAKFLRTFLLLAHESLHLSNVVVKGYLSKLKFLRVLSLSHYNITRLPTSIDILKHLRYIDLSHTAIKILPESVCALLNLQTFILSNCHSLTELPKNMSTLTKLRHLHIDGTKLNEMPKEMSRLERLQTLSNFVVGKKSGLTVTELGRLLYLHGTLHISKLQNMVSAKHAAEARLKEKTYLDELVLEWVEYTVDPKKDGDVLEHLVPHTNLKKLRIKFYLGSSFPNWLGDFSFSNMVFLRLSNCNNCLELPPVGQLSSLKVLIIEWMNAVKRVSAEFYGINKPFQSLETLTFEGMLEWEEWLSFEVKGDEFPCLQELCIRRCPKLKRNLPKQLPSIVKVEISESLELMNTLTMEALLCKKLLHYHDKVLFVSRDKVTSFSEQMNVFTSAGATESPLPITQAAMESSLLRTQGALESSLPMMQVATESDETVVPNSIWSNQDGLQDLPFESMKVSRMSQLMGLTGLHSLKIEGCDALESMPVEVMTRNPFLQHLYIINCCSFKSFPRSHPPTALKSLYIQNCKQLEFLLPAKRTHQFALLEHLCIGSSCDSMNFFPLDFFPKLKSLSIWACANLHSLSVSVGIQKDLTSLEALEIRDCPNLVSFPKGGLHTPNLTTIWFSNCKNLRELPDQLHSLNSVHSMLINNCPQLVSLSEGGLPSNLSLLSITFCVKLMLGTEWGLHRLDCLSQLEIDGGCGNVVSFPEEKLLPSNLNSLRISGLMNLEYLNYKGLQHLTALKTLEISCCNKLQPFPEEGLPSSLSFLCINECSLLKPKLQKKRKRLGSCIETDEEEIS
ncbi:hypothetical protein RGQ29_016520 [Quercus rubra]|uniref:NB-ARC domain-containing protein n=1 Tax=Quercus rubra TaxID=3512 RepID=A0AAN7FEL3_QUERU|nr:hypothetical protein RGQ29_016520 [Quercus rubra]